jgi:hypothetical protein
MPLVPSAVRAVFVPWSVAAVIVSSPSASASSGGAAQGSEQPAKAPTWACRLIPTDTVRPVVQKGMERSETIRRQCEELAAARAVVVLEWGAMADSQLHARTAMEVRDGVVVARVKLPPLGEIIVLMAHELEHVIEQTRGLDLRARDRADTRSRSPRRGRAGRVWCLAAFRQLLRDAGRGRREPSGCGGAPRVLQGHAPAAGMTASALLLDRAILCAERSPRYAPASAVAR